MTLPKRSHSVQDYQQWGKQVIQTEGRAVVALQNHITSLFSKAITIMHQCQGRIIVTGMGKSGHIASKIAATLASTGSPAFFVHPAEACHGDLGMIVKQDVVLAISYTGETREVLNMVEALAYKTIPLISLTGNPDSTLARLANVHLSVNIPEEACSLGLAPTSSTTACLVMGDALAITLLRAKNFTPDDFSRSHPGGSLGIQLRCNIESCMRQGHALPIVTQQTLIKDAIIEISRKGMGLTCVVGEQQQLMGVFTDGDLRRTLDQAIAIDTTPIIDAMPTARCKTITIQTPAHQALNIMKTHKITVLIVVNEQQQPTGILQLYDLLDAMT